MKKAKIGIITNRLHTNQQRTPHGDRYYINDEYIEVFKHLNAVPILLPPLLDLEDIILQIEDLDGIILSGGNDVDPSLYGETQNQHTTDVLKDIDLYNLKVIKSAKQLHIPLFGICKGLQMINVANGGTLYQDIPTMIETTINHAKSNDSHLGHHAISISNDSFLDGILENNTLVNSMHHQSIKQVGNNLKVIATSHDGVIEAIESTNNDLLYGVQFHPEIMARYGNLNALNIFKHFINICIQKRENTYEKQ